MKIRWMDKMPYNQMYGTHLWNKYVEASLMKKWKMTLVLKRTLLITLN